MTVRSACWPAPRVPACSGGERREAGQALVHECAIVPALLENVSGIGGHDPDRHITQGYIERLSLVARARVERDQAAAPRGGDWSFGGTAKLVDSALDTARATALTFDAGALWKGEKASFGGGVRNFGGKLRYRSQSDPLPSSYWAGGGWRPREDWLASASLEVHQSSATPAPATSTR